MVGGIIQIILGLFLWKVATGWIEFGSASLRSFVQLCLNVVGIILVIAGFVSIVQVLF